MILPIGVGVATVEEGVEVTVDIGGREISGTVSEVGVGIGVSIGNKFCDSPNR